MKRHIPNIFTLLNLLCGSIAIIFVIESNFVSASLFVFLGIFFDFFDGFLARRLDVQSDLGIQLDSLADMITSGLVPGMVMFSLIRSAESSWIYVGNDSLVESLLGFTEVSLWPLVGLLITLASAFRLARFNIDEDQQDYFKGLPTPANTLFIISIPLIMEFQNNDFLNDIILNKWFLIGLTLLSCYLLNSNLKLFALKFKDWSFKSNAIRYIFILASLFLLIVLRFVAVPFIVALYIIMSLFGNLTTK